MTIPEMQAWLESVEPGPTKCAVRESFQMCLQDQETVNNLATLIAHLRGTEETAYLLALGHYIAFASLHRHVEAKIRERSGAEDGLVQ